VSPGNIKEEITLTRYATTNLQEEFSIMEIFVYCEELVFFFQQFVKMSEIMHFERLAKTMYVVS